MNFTQVELICFNSVLDGKHIVGTHFKTPTQQDDYVQSTVISLQAKGFLNADEQPNNLFVAATKILQEYKNANEYLFLNKSRLALGPRFLVALTLLEDDTYDLTRMDKALFFAGLLEQSPSLKNADRVELQQVQISPARWNDTWKPRQTIKDYYWMQKMTNNTPGKLAISYQVDGELYVYYPAKATLVKCGPSYIRRLMMEMLGLDTLIKTSREE